MENVEDENHKLKNAISELNDELDDAIGDQVVVHNFLKEHYQTIRYCMVQAARARKWPIEEESDEWKAAYKGLAQVYDRIDRIPPTEYGSGAEGSGSESEQR